MTQRLGKKRFTDDIEVSGNVVSDGLTVSSVEIDPTGAASSQALIFNGTKFAPSDVAGGVEVSSTAPSDPSEGDFWFDSTTGSIFVYYDSFWIEVGSSSTITESTDSIPENLNDLLDVSANTPSNGDILRFNTSNSKWESVELPASGISLGLAIALGG